MDSDRKKALGLVGLALGVGLFGAVYQHLNPLRVSSHNHPNGSVTQIGEQAPASEPEGPRDYEIIKEYEGDLETGVSKYLKEQYNLDSYTFDSIFGQTIDASQVAALHGIARPPQDSSQFRTWFIEQYHVDPEASVELSSEVVDHIKGFDQQVYCGPGTFGEIGRLKFYLRKDEFWTGENADSLRTTLSNHVRELKKQLANEDNLLMTGKWEHVADLTSGPLYAFTRNIDPCIEPIEANEFGYRFSRRPKTHTHGCEQGDKDTPFPIHQRILYHNGKVVAPGYFDTLGWHMVGNSSTGHQGHLEKDISWDVVNNELFLTLTYCAHDASRLHGLIARNPIDCYAEVPTNVTLKFNGTSFEAYSEFRGFLERNENISHTSFFPGDHSFVSSRNDVSTTHNGHYAQRVVVPEQGKWVSYIVTDNERVVSPELTQQLSSHGPDDRGLWPKHHLWKFLLSANAQGRLGSERESSGDPYNPNFYRSGRFGVDRRYADGSERYDASTCRD